MTAVASNPQARSLKRLWSRLPAGPLTEEELDEKIIEITGAWPGDYALASAHRSSLVISRAVTVTPGDKPHTLVYERASDFPQWEPNDLGTDGYNRELQRQHREHEEMMRREDELHAQQLADSPLGQQRAQILALVDQRVNERVEEAVYVRIGELLRSLDEPTVARMRERLNGVAMAAPAEDDGRDAGQEGRTNE